MACRISLDQIRAMKEETLTAHTVGRVLGCDAQAIRVAAHQQKSLLGFPVIIIAHRVHIPRRAFIRYMEGLKK